ncbi:MAG: hypothetical protein ACTSQZ_07235 [Candidatus Thorarchaeota archaeon]
MKRIGRILIVLGVITIMLSVLSEGRTSHNRMVIDHESPKGVIFGTNQDIYVNVTLDHSVGTFNMYLLHWQDANATMAQNQSSNPILPISSFENITSFQDTLHLPFSGTFALLLTTNSTDLLIVVVDISAQGINTREFLGGLILAGSGLVILVYQRYGSRVPSDRSVE